MLLAETSFLEVKAEILFTFSAPLQIRITATELEC